LKFSCGDKACQEGVADALRPLARMRNEAAHGRLDVTLTRDQVAKLVQVTRMLLQLSPEDA
jgi:hypothetical protein